MRIKKRLIGFFVTLAIIVLLPLGEIQAGGAEVAPTELYNEVFQYTLDKYVRDLTPEELEVAAVKGMLQQLDRHSQYYDAREYREFQIEMEGSFGGVGMSVEQSDGYIVIIAPLAGTPAEKAGVKAGDRLLEVDQTKLDGLTLQDAVELIRGEPGTSVVLKLERDGKILQFVVTREVIEAVPVEAVMLPERIGYIKLSSFSTLAMLKHSQMLSSLVLDGARGIILDLRDNPGGYLGSALSVASHYVEEGKPLVHLKSRTDGDTTYRSNRSALALPLVVLINGSSASASEIVAGAVKDNRAGTLVGTKSYGKASVQHIYELANGGAIKLTTAGYFTPSDGEIDGIGIEPDLVIEDREQQLEEALKIILNEVGKLN
jgi:carboxyl-terminal processing protease